MEEKIFDLSLVLDPQSKVCDFPDYQLIKREFFQLAKPISEQQYPLMKFYTDNILPRCDETHYLGVQVCKRWMEFMLPAAIKLANMMIVHEENIDVTTLLEKEQEKLKQQFEIRQDVTETMWSYIKRLKDFVANDEKMSALSHKEMVSLYEMIRAEEDRAKTLSLKERSEDRADAMFAWMVSQAKAGQLTAEDINLLDDDIRKDLLIFKNENGIYQLPTSNMPKIKFRKNGVVKRVSEAQLAAKVVAAQPNQSA